ncbi:MAG TPA: hypothetical protein VKX30_00220 [Flavobacteriaceae bacterium]|nr:hypothetical protein [Flavobacteriaceae bacterium]
MKSKWHILRIFLLLVLTGFLFSFSNKRNQERKLADMLVMFTNPEQLFIPMETIQSLLTNNSDSLDFYIGDVKIKELEAKVLAHPMVAEAEVYLSVNGVLGAEITQRTPIGRCLNKDGAEYIDELGEFMPLSSNSSARVPLVYGVKDSLSRAEVMPLLLAIREDDFMRQSVVTITRNKVDDMRLKLRQNKLDIALGEAEDLEYKFRKLKGFIKYTKDNNTIEDYKTIDLRYNNQVVATKI